MVALKEIVGKWLITHGLWLSRSPDLNICNYYLCRTLKDRVNTKNPHQLQELKHNIQGEI